MQNFADMLQRHYIPSMGFVFWAGKSRFSLTDQTDTGRRPDTHECISAFRHLVRTRNSQPDNGNTGDCVPPLPCVACRSRVRFHYSLDNLLPSKLHNCGLLQHVKVDLLAPRQRVIHRTNSSVSTFIDFCKIITAKRGNENGIYFLFV